MAGHHVRPRACLSFPRSRSSGCGLAEHVVGRRIDDVAVLTRDRSAATCQEPHDFAARLTGVTVGRERERRGKYLWLPSRG